MQIVIEIPNEEVPNKQEIIDISLHFIAGEVCECNYPYTVLPKGHGRLIDADKIISEATERMKYPANHEYMECVIAHMKLATTIIEADGGDAE